MFFFFSSRRRHTRLQGDWSSDVCSSDLALVLQSPAPFDCAPTSSMATLVDFLAERREDQPGYGRALDAVAAQGPLPDLAEFPACTRPTADAAARALLRASDAACIWRGHEV